MPDALKEVNPWLIAISVMLATFMEVMDTSIAAVAVPYIAGSVSALFLRRKTISPKNRTASTAQTMRIIELSIVFLLSGEIISATRCSSSATVAA